MNQQWNNGLINFGLLEWLNDGKIKCWNLGMNGGLKKIMEYWISVMIEGWNCRVMEIWQDGMVD